MNKQKQKNEERNRYTVCSQLAHFSKKKTSVNKNLHAHQ